MKMAIDLVVVYANLIGPLMLWQFHLLEKIFFKAITIFLVFVLNFRLGKLIHKAPIMVFMKGNPQVTLNTSILLDVFLFGIFTFPQQWFLVFG